MTFKHVEFMGQGPVYPLSPTNQSHCTGAKGQVPVLLALCVGSESELHIQSLK